MRDESNEHACPLSNICKIFLYNQLYDLSCKWIQAVSESDLGISDSWLVPWWSRGTLTASTWQRWCGDFPLPLSNQRARSLSVVALEGQKMNTNMFSVHRNRQQMVYKIKCVTNRDTKQWKSFKYIGSYIIFISHVQTQIGHLLLQSHSIHLHSHTDHSN